MKQVRSEIMGLHFIWDNEAMRPAPIKEGEPEVKISLAEFFDLMETFPPTLEELRRTVLYRDIFTC